MTKALLQANNVQLFATRRQGVHKSGTIWYRGKLYFVKWKGTYYAWNIKEEVVSACILRAACADSSPEVWIGRLMVDGKERECIVQTYLDLNTHRCGCKDFSDYLPRPKSPSWLAIDLFDRIVDNPDRHSQNFFTVRGDKGQQKRFIALDHGYVRFKKYYCPCFEDYRWEEAQRQLDKVHWQKVIRDAVRHGATESSAKRMVNRYVANLKQYIKYCKSI